MIFQHNNTKIFVFGQNAITTIKAKNCASDGFLWHFSENSRDDNYFSVEGALVYVSKVP